jgi:hypothetical protein
VGPGKLSDRDPGPVVAGQAEHLVGFHALSLRLNPTTRQTRHAARPGISLAGDARVPDRAAPPGEAPPDAVGALPGGERGQRAAKPTSTGPPGLNRGKRDFTHLNRYRSRFNARKLAAGLSLR